MFLDKCFFATTALLATTGIAAAEMSLGGTARMGVVQNDGETREEYRMRLNFTGTTETDSGMSVTAFTRMNIDESFSTTNVNQDTGDNAGDAYTDDNGFNGAGVTLAYQGITVAMGNVDGAVNTNVNLYPAIVGLDGWGDYQSPAFGAADGHTEFTSNGNGPSQTRIDLSVDAFTISVSTQISGSDNDMEVAASYSMGDINFGVGMLSDEDNSASGDATYMSVDGAFGPLTAGIGYINSDGLNESAFVVGAAYAVSDALTVDAMYGDNGNGAFMTSETSAVGFDYSMGGGVTLRGSLGQDSAGNDNHTFGLAVAF